MLELISDVFHVIGVRALACMVSISPLCFDAQNHFPGPGGKQHMSETSGRQGEQDHLVLDPSEQKIYDPKNFHGLLMPLKPRRKSFSLRALFTQRIAKKISFYKTRISEELCRCIKIFILMPNTHF